MNLLNWFDVRRGPWFMISDFLGSEVSIIETDCVYLKFINVSGHSPVFNCSHKYVVHIEFIGMFFVYLQNKFHTSSSKGALLIPSN